MFDWCENEAEASDVQFRQCMMSLIVLEPDLNFDTKIYQYVCLTGMIVSPIPVVCLCSDK